jgi:hypothetical protein
MKKIVSFVFLSFLLTISSNLSAELIEDIIISGKVTKIKRRSLVLQDWYGQEHIISKDEIKNKKLKEGNILSVSRKLDYESLYQWDGLIDTSASLTKEDSEKLYTVLINFLKMIDRNQGRGFLPNERGIEKKTSSTRSLNRSLLNLILPEAISKVSKPSCLFAGWPSTLYTNGKDRKKPTRCLTPWSRLNNTKSISGYKSCGGGDNVFRCNPQIFGDGIEDNDQSKALGEKAISLLKALV